MNALNWQLVRLIRGPAFPKTIVWEAGVEASIPVLMDSLQIPPSNEEVVLYGFFDSHAEPKPLVWGHSGHYEFAFSVSEWSQNLQIEAYRPEPRFPLSARLPFHYHRIPASIRNWVASLLLRQKSHVDPSFPETDFNPGCEIILILAEIANFKGPVLVLTHDVDTKEGFRHIDSILKIEERFKFHSSWNFVPRSYKIDYRVLENILGRKGEIGLHGIWHNNSEVFIPQQKFREELNQLEKFRSRFGIRGYRSPSWYRRAQMYPVLSEFFDYDLSAIDNDRCCPGGPGGVGWMEPFVHPEGLVELPCTLPFEGPIFQGVPSEKLGEYWAPKIRFLHANAKLLLVNTHPDSNYLGNPKMLKAYADFLEKLSTMGWKNLLPYELANQILKAPAV